MERDGISSETARKLVHIGIGFFAFTLRWITMAQAAAVAAVAVIMNAFVLPAIGGRRIMRTQTGMDRGIVLYPIAVLALILIFHDAPAIAAAVWATLAFGDGAATLIGLNVRGRALPWNPNKSIAGTLGFVEIGLPMATIAWFFVGPPRTYLSGILIVAVMVIVCAIVESLDLNLDDNLTVPLTGGIVIHLMTTIDRIPVVTLDRTTAGWLLANAILAGAGYFAGSVSASGMVGGFALGAAIIAFGSWELYVVLLVFFIIGSALTKIGYETKRGLGVAQEKEGRRGFSHAFSNTGVAAILALLLACSSIDPILLWMGAIAALATATADTSGSEIGQLLGRRAFLPLTFRRVPRGTEGAISVEGTLAGLLGGAVVAWIGTWLLGRHVGAESGFVLRATLTITGAAMAGSWIESVVGSWNRAKSEPVPNGALNFFNTAVGAVLGIVFTKLVFGV